MWLSTYTQAHIHYSHTEIRDCAAHRNIQEHRNLSRGTSNFINKIALIMNHYIIFLSNEWVKIIFSEVTKLRADKGHSHMQLSPKPLVYISTWNIKWTGTATSRSGLSMVHFWVFLRSLGLLTYMCWTAPRAYGGLIFTFMHLVDAFIQSDSQCYTLFSVCVFPGNRTHNVFHC